MYLRSGCFRAALIQELTALEAALKSCNLAARLLFPAPLHLRLLLRFKARCLAFDGAVTRHSEVLASLLASSWHPLRLQVHPMAVQVGSVGETHG